MHQGPLASEGRKEEQRLIDGIRAEHPERVDRQAIPDPDFIAGRIGIHGLSQGRPDGYIKLFPQDFLVQEVLPGGEVVPLLQRQDGFQDAEDRRTLWVDLMKACLPGPHAISDVANLLGIENGQVGYAGVKDSFAVTSQRLSLRGVSVDDVRASANPHLFLRPVKYGSGVLNMGGLDGNQFTIVVRGSKPASDSLHEDLQIIEQRGFPNVFGAQRFGPRLISHELGKKLLQDDMDGALKLFFATPGPFDVPLYREIREELGHCFGDWEAMEEVVQHFPYTFFFELQVLRALKKEPRKTRQALSQIQDQVRLWIYAYSSHLVNRLLTENGEYPLQTVRLPFSETKPLPEFAEQMREDGTERFADILKYYPYIRTGRQELPARVKPKHVRLETIPEGWVLRFRLDRGAYATSFLSFIFRLYEGLPIPSWVPLTEVDSLAVLGEGNLEEIKKRFGTVLLRRDRPREDEEGE